MIISERRKEILRAVVEQYVETAEPVGSKLVAARLGVLSAATVRNEMAELETMGLLEQPHTSAGRVPSAQGYRVYVNELMRKHKLSSDDTREISRTLKTADGSELLGEAEAITSRLTAYPAYAVTTASGVITVARFDLIAVDSLTFIIVALLSNDTVKNKLVHLTAPVDPAFLEKLSTVFNASFTGIPEERIVPALINATERALCDTAGLVAVVAGYVIELLSTAKSEKARIAGELRLFDQPEYRDIEKAQRLIRYLSDDKELKRLPSPESPGQIKITIGPENLADELRDSSVMAVRYDIGGDMQGFIGVVGPTRMDYGKVAARLEFIARGMSILLAGGDTPQITEENTMTGVDDIDE